jgi:hypothetical protein
VVADYRSLPELCAPGHHAAPAMGCAMKVELIQCAADVLWGIPAEARLEIVMLIEAAASAPPPGPGATAAAFGPSCWIEYVARGGVLEVIDVGCLC